MRNVRSLTLAAAGLALFAGSLSAQRTGKVQWIGVNGSTGKYNTNGSSSSQWYVYTSPYQAQFQITTPTSPPWLMPPHGTTSTTWGPTQDIFCVDFNHEATLGTWTANFTNLGSNRADVGIKTRSAFNPLITHDSLVHNYLAAAWLAEQIEAAPQYSIQRAEENGALWMIMSGAPKYTLNGSTAYDNTTVGSYFSTALTTGWKSVNPYEWVVITDTHDVGSQTGPNQEFLTRVVTPEPATLLLMGTGLFGMLLGAAVLRRSLA